MYHVTARLESRNWWVDGKYLGDESPFKQATTTPELKAIMEQEIQNRLLMLKNDRNAVLGEKKGHPMRVGDWGEVRIITHASLI